MTAPDVVSDGPDPGGGYMGTPALNKALAAFQAELPHVGKDATAHYGKYADIEDVSTAVLPLLGKHSLAFTCEPGLDPEGHLVLAYTLLHESGQERSQRFPLWLFVPERATSQTIGGMITYFRRYCLLAVTGVAPGGDDDDGKAASDGHEETSNTHPVGRTRGDNPWEQPAPTFGEAVMREFKRLQIPDRDVRLGYIAAITGRAVNTPAGLTDEEKKHLLQVLSKCANQAALDALAQQEVTT